MLGNQCAKRRLLGNDMRAISCSRDLLIYYLHVCGYVYKAYRSAVYCQLHGQETYDVVGQFDGLA